MNRARVVGIAAGMGVLALTAFVLGRHVESTRIAASREQVRVSSSDARRSAPTATSPEYRQLPIGEILSLPFAEFYEALRSAPRQARAKWAAELEQLPPGPRKTAAILAYYKLLVQFDPKEAARAIREYKGDSGKGDALDAVVSGAPPAAMPEIAALLAEIKDPRLSGPDLGTVLYQWSQVDPVAAFRFLEAHPAPDHLAPSDMISNWASIDPVAAKQWLDQHPMPPDRFNPDPFITGWYENDPVAAVTYTLQHIDELLENRTVATIGSALYSDAKGKATKFIEALPDHKTRRKVLAQMASDARYGTAEETGEPERTPQAIAEWMTHFPAEDWTDALSKVLAVWSHNSQTELIQWIARQPPAIRDAVADEFTPEFDQGLNETWQTIFQVSDEQLRDRLLTATIRRNLGSGEEATRQLQQAALSPAERLQLFAIVDRVAEESAKQNPPSDGQK